MHIIKKQPFNDAAKKYPNDAAALMETYRVLSGNSFHTPDELRAVFPSLDNFKYKTKWWVIDIGGNNLRLMAFIQFVNQRLYVKHIVDHEEYDKLTAKYMRNSD